MKEGRGRSAGGQIAGMQPWDLCMTAVSWVESLEIRGLCLLVCSEASEIVKTEGGV
jgi:hypothetical protein